MCFIPKNSVLNTPPNTRILTFQKKLLHTLFFARFKIVKSLQFVLKEDVPLALAQTRTEYHFSLIDSTGVMRKNTELQCWMSAKKFVWNGIVEKIP